MRRALPLLAGAAVASCTGTKAPPPSPELAPVALEVEPSGHTVVATVDGTPVYDHCVIEQARATGATREDALRACIEFELLASAAADRFSRDPEVHETRKREMVRALLERDFEPSADEPTDIPESYLRDDLWKRREVYIGFNRPEYRVATFALARYHGKNGVVPRQQDILLRLRADSWHVALLAAQPDDATEFYQTVKGIAGDTPFEFDDNYNTPLEGRSVQAFAEALFALEKPGDISPVVHSQYGYFVIQLRSILPALSTSFDEAVPKMRAQIFDRWQKLAFGKFVGGLFDKAEVTTYEQNLAKVRIDLPSQFQVKP